MSLEKMFCKNASSLFQNSSTCRLRTTLQVAIPLRGSRIFHNVATADAQRVK